MSDNKPRLNVFALPSQTNLLSSLIILVLLGGFALGSLNAAPVRLFPFAVALILISLRSFIASAHQEIEEHQLKPADANLGILLNSINQCAKQIGLKKPVKLLVSPEESFNANAPYTFGSFNKWFIAISLAGAEKWQLELKDNLQSSVAYAKIFHELYHFKNYDHVKLGFAGALLKTTISFTGWALAFLLGMGFLLLISAPDIAHFNPQDSINQAESMGPAVRQLLMSIMPATEELATIQQKAASINFLFVITFIINALLPSIISSAVLLLLFFPKLWRIRELYADAGTVHALGSIPPYLAALTNLPVSMITHYSLVNIDTTRKRRVKIGFLTKVRTNLINIKLLNRWQPGTPTRIECIYDPQKVFDSWKGTAALVGSLVLLLDILLSSPLTLMYIGEIPMHFATLTVLVIVSICLIPQIIADRAKALSDCIKIALVISGIRLAWISFTLGVLTILLNISPGLLSDILYVAVANAARFAGNAPMPIMFDLSEFVVKATSINLLQVLVIYLIIQAGLISNVYCISWLFSCYKSPMLFQRLGRMPYFIIFISVIFWGGAILYPVTKVMLFPSDLFSFSSTAIWLSSMIISCLGFGWLFIYNRRYIGRCPSCGCVLPGNYWTGRSCEFCNERLLPGLLVEY